MALAKNEAESEIVLDIFLNRCVLLKRGAYCPQYFSSQQAVLLPCRRPILITKLCGLRTKYFTWLA